MKKTKIFFGGNANNLELFNKRIESSEKHFDNASTFIPSVCLYKNFNLLQKYHFYKDNAFFYFMGDSKIKLFKKVINIYVEVYWDLENRLNKILKIPRV